MLSYTSDNVLLVLALEAEAQDCFKDFSTCFCGVGKVNASVNLSVALAKWKEGRGGRPDLIINVGSAGSTHFPQGETVNCIQFMQRDMDATALGTPLYTTPFDDTPALFSYGVRCEAFPMGICGSGDNFSVEGTKNEWSVTDMEAYALAKFCAAHEIPFCCFKYITDGADDCAVRSWEDTLPLAARALRQAVDALIRREEPNRQN